VNSLSETLNRPSESSLSRGQTAAVRGRRLFEHTTVIDSIVAEIKGKIVSGELKDGDMLASQDELARILGVSRTSLREALNRLSLMGLVEVRHGSGTFVKTTRPQDFMNSLSSLLIMDQSSAGELLQARFYVEAALAALAAVEATDEELDRMRVLLERMENCFVKKEDDDFVDLDAQFHVLVAESSKNRVLMKVLELIREILPQCIRRFHLTFPGSVPTTLKYHQKIYEAIRARDPAAAKQQMEAHIGFLMQLNSDSEAGLVESN
jgi:GntR family transcriptional regulator, transcriptional repressor for pyruvate dehydrogenase complex